MKNRKPLVALLLGLMALTQLAASCASNPDYGDPGDGGGYGGGNNGDFDRPRRIPRNADIIRDGNDRLRWTADLDGTVYLYDVDSDRIAYTGSIRRNQEIVANPDKDRVWIDQREVYTQNLERDHRHQLYFAANRPDQGRGQGSGQGRGQGRGQGSGPADQIPRDAQRMAIGTGNLAIDRAASGGTVIVYDETDLRTVYTTELGRGNSFQIFPRNNYVNVNSTRAATVRFTSGHRYSLYFRPR